MDWLMGAARFFVNSSKEVSGFTISLDYTKQSVAAEGGEMVLFMFIFELYLQTRDMLTKTKSCVGKQYFSWMSLMLVVAHS